MKNKLTLFNIASETGKTRAGGGAGVSNPKKNDTVVFELFVHKVLKYYTGRYYFNACARQKYFYKANLRWRSFIFSLLAKNWQMRTAGRQEGY